MKFICLFLIFLVVAALEGIEYRNFKSEDSTVHVLDVDPTFLRLSMFRALEI